jgi:hypothetical protein
LLRCGANVSQAEASEPAVEGSNKFHFTAKGHKHTFKAASAAERDNWVAQLKVKIAEAKELAATVTESETYKKTLESLKPAPVKKEEKTAVAEPVAEPAAEAAPATEEAAIATEAATTEPAKEEAKEEEKAEKEQPKRRSASRKRTSIFGNLLGKKEEKKAAEPAEAKPAEAEPAVVEAPAAPAAETAAETAAEPATEVAPVATEAAAEAKPEEKAEEPKKEEKKEVTEARPAHIKRTR